MTVLESSLVSVVVKVADLLRNEVSFVPKEVAVRNVVVPNVDISSTEGLIESVNIFNGCEMTSNKSIVC